MAAVLGLLILDPWLGSSIDRGTTPFVESDLEDLQGFENIFQLVKCF